MELVNKIACILVIIGALNWGLVGFFNFDLVAFLFGMGSFLSMIVYDIVGLSALWCIFAYAGKKMKKQ
ncbi:MAG: DUF378 domain-containing protein [Alphaproteobacteria bacterium]|nr:DUF378 domain-containing protein [Alphaproteobacteria bacterium]